MGFESWFRKLSGESEKKDDVKKGGGVEGGQTENNNERKAWREGGSESDNTRFISDKEIEADLGDRYDVMMGRARSLDELQIIIRRNKISLKGSKQSFSPNELCDVIDKIRSKEYAIDMATSTMGFRDVVRSLAEKEGVINKE